MWRLGPFGAVLVIIFLNFRIFLGDFARRIRIRKRYLLNHRFLVVYYCNKQRGVALLIFALFPRNLTD